MQIQQNYPNMMQNYEAPQRDIDAKVSQFLQELRREPEMPDDVAKAFKEALDTLDESDRLTAMSLTFLGGGTLNYAELKSRVESRLNPTDGGYTSEEAKESLRAFWSAFDKIYGDNKGEQTKQESEDEELTDLALEQFLHDLRSKGAAKFLADLNQSKIDKLVEEYKQKLIDDKQKASENGISEEDLLEIDALVAQYRDSLLEQMRVRFEDELKHDKNANPIKIDAFVMGMLEGGSEARSSKLEDLLR